MISMDIDKIVYEVKEKVIGHHPQPISWEEKLFKGVSFTFDVAAGDFSTRMRARRDINILVLGHSYTFVSYGRTPLLKDWVNIDNHDSCWKDSLRHEIFRFYVELAEACNPNIPPKDISFHTTVWGDLWDVVQGRVTKEDDDFRRKLLSLELHKE